MDTTIPTLPSHPTITPHPEETDRYARQVALEHEAVNMGTTRYRKDVPLPWRKEAGGKKEETELPPGKKLLKEAVEPTAALIRDFMEKAAEGKAGRKHTAVKYLRDVLPEQAAYITAKTALNAASRRKGQTVVSMGIAQGIQDHLDFTTYSTTDFLEFTKLSNSLERHASARMRKAILKRKMREKGIVLLDWTDGERAQLGSKLLELFIEATHMVEVVEDKTRHNRVKRVVQPTEQMAQWLDEQHARCELLSPVLLPMVVPPKPWTTPYTGGYLSSAVKLRMVKTRNRDYLDELGSVHMPEVYHAVNAIQNVPWRINRNVLRILHDVWDTGGNLGKLPPREGLSRPPKPLDIDTNEDSKNAWKKEVAKIEKHNAITRSDRLAVSQKLWLSEKFADEGAIYFPHQLDFRGRVYPAVPLLNPQGDDVSKALLEFAEGQPVGEYGGFWLAVHIANLYGKDKVPFEERVQWVNEHDKEILDSAIDPMDGGRFWTEAKKPWMALAASFEWLAFKMQGEAYESHLPVSIDGSCSGLQHYSLVLKDAVGGAAVNLVPAERPADIYSQVALRAQAVADTSTDPESVAWRGGKIIRDIAKQPTMTFCYASTRHGMSKMILSALKELDKEGKLRGTGPYLKGADNFEAAKWLSYVMESSIGEVVVAAQEAMDWLKSAARIASKTGLPIWWTTPTGFPVMHVYHSEGTQRQYVFFQGSRVRLDLRHEKKGLNKKRMASAVAPNWVHSLDAAHLMKAVSAADRDGIKALAVVHDSFGTHAADVDHLGFLLRRSFVDQYEGNLLEKFRDELAIQIGPEAAAELPPLPPTGSLDLAAVMESQFCFA